MSVPRTIPLVRSWAVVLVMIAFARVQLSSAAKITVENTDNSTDLGHFKIIVKKDPLELKCSIDEEGYNFIWGRRVSEGVYEEIKEGVTKSQNGKETTLRIAKPGDENAGIYNCSVKSNNTEIPPGVINVLSYPTGTLESDVIVVEGEKLILDCQPTGVPTPKVSWRIGENNTLNASTERVKLLPNKNNISNAMLEIRDVKMTDRADYTCILTNTATLFKSEVEIEAKVRVKDKLAALWPFLGICAEVFVLCAIIFIYEKKRNKAELDESDTDNSPEQKNTPDHGKDSVRQRK